MKRAAKWIAMLRGRAVRMKTINDKGEKMTRVRRREGSDEKEETVKGEA